ncbi:contractile injection system protein, VgrG/Pvc8 family [Schinkia azotoformans]|uniref:phage baseplate assembly protein V n=1 Tax=Schinkia azotoformans TaxID=1454 RepID=UPI002E23E75C|nr:contractile injection system protein, VgrG/Pvc8 family [Schinkia azotoformans]
MKTKESAAGYGEIELLTPYGVQTIYNLKWIRTMNDHVKLYVTGIVSEEVKDSCLDTASSVDQIELNQLKDGQVVRPLFKGMVSELAVRKARDIYYIELEAISHTYRMDIEQKSRSFQQKEMLYTQMIDKIVADYLGADSIDNIAISTKLGKLIVQYKETDWQFLKRMASHFGAVLIPDATANGPKFWFGLPEGQTGKLNSDHYSLAKDVTMYRKTIENYDESLQVADFQTYTIESTQYFNMGDRITIKNTEHIVAQATATMKQGILTYEYVLAPEAGIRQNLIHHSSLRGGAIEGNLIDVAKDKVRVHLEIDEAQSKDEATWFPYSTFYTAEGNSGFYSMPELGDTVQLYFPSDKEEEAVVISSVRKGGASNPKTADPTTKYWGTNHGKEMKMNASEVMFTAKEGTIFLRLDTEAGIEIHSQHNVLFQAEKNLEMTGGQAIQFKAGESIHMTCHASSIVMDGITDIQGELVKMEGWVKAAVPTASEEEDDDDDDELGAAVLGMIPDTGGGGLG